MGKKAKNLTGDNAELARHAAVGHKETPAEVRDRYLAVSVMEGEARETVT